MKSESGSYCDIDLIPHTLVSSLHNSELPSEYPCNVKREVLTGRNIPLGFKGNSLLLLLP